MIDDDHHQTWDGAGCGVERVSSCLGVNGGAFNPLLQLLCLHTPTHTNLPNIDHQQQLVILESRHSEERKNRNPAQET
jgi:hypothetical protein